MRDSAQHTSQTLIPFKNGELAEHNAFELLPQVSAEQVGLSNFSSENTRSNYHRAIPSFVATVGIASPQELYAFKQAHVLAWRAGMEQAGLSRATIGNRLAALSSLFKHLTDQNLTSANPVAGIKRPKTGNAGIGAGKSPTLSKRQVRAILEAQDVTSLQGLRDRALLHILFYVGARCSEPLKLKVKDFTYDAEFPVLHLTIKGNKLNTVAINLECAAAIRAYLDQAQHRFDPEAYILQPVFPTDTRRTLTRQLCYYLFQRYAAKAGIDVKAFPHVARATMITSAYDAGATGEAIQRTVGHSSITTTEGYNHTMQKHRESSSLKVGY
ncbi:MAG: tyrosine-type recombinase/integrase [Pseudomonadota bacterium]